MCLERENAIAHWREVMGATDPAKAAAGTIRKLFASNIEKKREPRLGRAGDGGVRDRLVLQGVRAQRVVASSMRRIASMTRNIESHSIVVRRLLTPCSIANSPVFQRAIAWNAASPGSSPHFA